MAEPAAGKYRLEARLGAGAMGEVWKALDTELNRAVALKFLKGGDDEEIARFEREAQIAGKLTHPNIAAIYEVGLADHRHFLAMQFVDGRTLKTVPRNDVRELVRIARDVARALDYAHRQGVIHRDIKPDNLMLSVDGQAFVMDFGLARSVKAGSSMTASGMMVGTPAYMSPEQARGEVRTLDARTDVYGLGATMYELFTDRAPFRGETALEVALRVIDEEPAAPRRLNHALDADLETIVVKCMEKDRAQRYATAGEVAADLERWLQGEPILARPASITYRLRKKMVKRKAVLGVGALGAAAVIVVLAVLLPTLGSTRRLAELGDRIGAILTEAEISARSADRETAHAKLEEGIALCRASLASSETAMGRYLLGRLLHRQGKLAEARRELDRALELDPALGEAQYERGLLLLGLHGARALEMGCGTAAAAEARAPELAALREAAAKDLAVEVGRSAFFKESDGHFGRGELARMSGNRQEAAVEFQRALDKDPNHARARLSFARLLKEQGDLDDAIREAGEALARHRGFGEAWATRAAWHVQKSQGETDSARIAACVDRALADLEMAERAGFSTADVHSTRGSVLSAKGLAKEALAEYDHALRLTPQNSGAFGNRATVKMALGDLRGAIADCDAAIALDPNLMHAWLNRSAAKAQSGDHLGAIDDCDHILARLAPKYPQAWCNRALSKMDLGRAEAAMADFDEALRLDAKLLNAWRGRARLKSAMGDHRGAARDYEEAVKLDGSDADTWRMRSAALINLADRMAAQGKGAEARPVYEGALGDAEQAIRLNPKFAAAIYNRGLARLRLGEHERAIKDLGEALAAAPGMADALLLRASAHTELRDRLGRESAEGRRHDDAAMADLDRLVRTQPKYIPGYVNRANLHLERRNWDAAARDAEAAIALGPSAEAHGVRGMALQSKGDKAGAAACYRKALEQAPAAWSHRDLIAGLLRGLEK